MTEERQSEIKAKLKIADFECSPEEITEILGICPTKIWRRGEKVHPRAKNVYKSNGWMLASPCDPVNSSRLVTKMNDHHAKSVRPQSKF